MNVLVVTRKFDIHATAMKCALEQKGASVEVWCIEDFPSKAHIAMTAADGSGVQVHYEFPTMPAPSNLSFDACIFRRYGGPHIPDFVAKSDHKFASRVSALFVDGIVTNLSKNTFCVNSVESLRTQQRKPTQLSIAQESGFSIPDTIITNSPRQAIEFCEKHGDRVVYKNLLSGIWMKESSAVSAQLISFVNSKMIRELGKGLEICPGIFQAYIPKAYEIRAVVMGNTIICAKIDSQSSSDTKEDWRGAYRGQQSLSFHECQLPDDIREKILKYMKLSGLVFGCMDLIIKPDGGAVFLEINEMGQFLWMEEECPTFTLLDCFAEFVLSKDPHFIYSKSSNPIYYRELKTSSAFEAVHKDIFSDSIDLPSNYIFQEA